MKKCGSCGCENRAESKFCQNCGAELNAPKADKNLKERFKNANILIKLAIIICIIFALLFAVGWMEHIFFGIPLEPNTEADATDYPSQFDSFDINGDGALSFNEVEALGSHISYNNLKDIFDSADKSDDGVLKGGEFDGYLSYIDMHDRIEEHQKSKEKEKSSSSSSKSGNSIPQVSNKGKCPSCGSDQEYMYDYYDEFGHPYYQCTVCDYWTYDESEFYD